MSSEFVQSVISGVSPPKTLFNQITGHLLVDLGRAEATIPTGGEDSPPPFIPYETERH